MPRVRLKATTYKVADLKKFIKHKLIDLGKNQYDLAMVLGITPPSFTNRMKKGLFSYGELLTILNELEATDEEILKLMRK